MSRLRSFAAGLAESSWLAAMAIVPSLFFVRVQLVRMFEPAKASAVRCLAVTTLAALLFLAFAQGREKLLSVGAACKTPAMAFALAIGWGFALSNMFSVAPAISFWGDYQRRQGTFTELSYVVMFVAIVLLVRRRGQIEMIISTALVGSVLPAVYSCWQAWQIDPLPWNDADRTFGTAGNPIALAGFLIMVWPLTLARAMATVPRRLDGMLRVPTLGPFAVNVGLLIVQSLAIVYTRSRGPVVGWCAGIVCFGVLLARPSAHSRHRRPLYAFGAAVVLAMLVPTVWMFSKGRSDAASTVNVRAVIWRAALNVVSDHPLRLLSGHGPETLPLIIQQRYPVEIEHLEPHTDLRIDRAHNAILDSVLTRGSGALAEICFVISIVGLAVRRTWRDDGRRMADGERLLMCGFVSALCAHFVEIQFFSPVTSTRLLFWIYSGASVVIMSESVEASDRLDPLPFFATDRLRLMLMVGMVLAVFTLDFSTGVVSQRRVFSMLAVVWLMAASLVAAHSSDPDHERAGMRGFVRSLTIGAAVSGVMWLAFSLLYVSYIQSAGSALNATPPDVVARQFANALSIAFGFGLLVIAISALGGGARSHQESHDGFWRAMIVAGGAMFAIVLGVAPSVRESRAAIVAGLGESKAVKQDWIAAAQFYEQAAQLQPDDAEYRVQAGRMFMERAKVELSPDARREYLRKALLAFDLARRRSPLDGRYVRLLALTQHLSAQLAPPQDRKGHLDEAERLYGEAVAITPRSASLWEEWGAFAAARGENDTARARLTRSISLNNRVATAFSERAYVESRLGADAEAAADSQRARELSAGTSRD